jgi:hypothetical protein
MFKAQALLAVLLGFWASVNAFSSSSVSLSLKGTRSLPLSVKRIKSNRGQSPVARLEAILLDCDGVLADTERDGHRVALNMAMKERGLKVGTQDMKCDEKVILSLETSPCVSILDPIRRIVFALFDSYPVP